jgi:hypothetical protein
LVFDSSSCSERFELFTGKIKSIKGINTKAKTTVAKDHIPPKKNETIAKKGMA